MAKPGTVLIPGRAYQDEAFRVGLRRLFLLWSRQRGKSYELSRQSFNRMMKFPGRLVTFISASMTLGTELLRKEAEQWQAMLEKMRSAAGRHGLRLTSSGDGLDFDAVCDLFEHSKFETRLWHSRSVCSRTRVIAPNPDTAVGWTSDIFGDEVGRWPNAQDVFEAIEPFMASHPELIMRLATTPPPDDRHFTFEAFAPPPGLEFPVNARGNFYRSPSGIMVHRVDVWDGCAAGVPLYHPDTGEPIPPEQHRALAFDKQAWDRNYGLAFLAGGTAAISMASITRAMEQGRDNCIGINVTETIAP
ncbi:MAG: hypothetical protein D6781_10665 [Verrucomicrobia bacterium]|nr:MAG: hypothetical protein D6781_10665 [Verrucomicrobiota bacterium]